jgi:hypothetical protein
MVSAILTRPTDHLLLRPRRKLPRNDFVPARVHHSFFDVTQRLALLVFFDPA